MERGGGGGRQVESVVYGGRRRWGHLLVVIVLHILSYLPQASFTEVTYVCFSKGESMLHLECPSHTRLRVIETKHGRNRWGICALLQGGDETEKCTQFGPVVDQCCGRGRCNVTMTPVFIPTCGYSSSFVRVIHECVTDINVTCSAKEEGDPQKGASETGLPSTPTQPDEDEARLSTESERLTLPSETSTDNPVTTTIDPAWLAKLNNTERTGERHIFVKSGSGSKPSGGNGDASLQAVWACLAIALIIIGSLIAILLYVWRRKKLQETSESNKPPDNNNEVDGRLEEKQVENKPSPVGESTGGGGGNSGVGSPQSHTSPVGSPQSHTSPEPRIIRVASRRRYSSMREFQTKDSSIFTLPEPDKDDPDLGPSRLNRTLSMNSFVLSDTLTRKRKSREGEIQLVIKPNTEADPV